jgi:hypothetical protein
MGIYIEFQLNSIKWIQKSDIYVSMSADENKTIKQADSLNPGTLMGEHVQQYNRAGGIFRSR